MIHEKADTSPDLDFIVSGDQFRSLLPVFL